jgi:NADPH:quinone reductase-like Zn-dependent oxidoreductase
MKAVIRHRYGSPDVLELADVDKPLVSDDGVVVRVRASSLNSGDLDYLSRSTPTDWPARVRPEDGARSA